MDLDVLLLDDLVAHQESLDVLTVVTLKLNNLSQVFVLHNSAVAAELLHMGSGIALQQHGQRATPAAADVPS